MKPPNTCGRPDTPPTIFTVCHSHFWLRAPCHQDPFHPACLLPLNIRHNAAPFPTFSTQRSDAVVKRCDYFFSLNNKKWNSGQWHLRGHVVNKKSICA